MIEAARFRLTDQATSSDVERATAMVVRLVPALEDQELVLRALGIISDPAPAPVAAVNEPGPLEVNVRARVWALRGSGLSAAEIIRATKLPRATVSEILADPPTGVVVNPAAVSASTRRAQLRDEIARLLGAGVSADVIPSIVRCSRKVLDDLVAELADLPQLPPVRLSAR